MAQTLQRQVISGALALFADEKKWTRGEIARTRDGWPCTWDDPEAFQYCALGALIKAAHTLTEDCVQARHLAMQASREVLAANNRIGCLLTHINDFEGHTVILEMFQKA